MEEDYSEYVKKLRDMQTQKIAERAASRKRLAAPLTVVERFANALHQSHEVDEVTTGAAGSDCPSLVITPLRFGSTIHVRCTIGEMTHGNKSPMISIQVGSSGAVRIEAGLLADDESFNPSQKSKQDQQRREVFTTIIEGIAQLKADAVPPKESGLPTPQRQYA